MNCTVHNAAMSEIMPVLLLSCSLYLMPLQLSPASKLFTQCISQTPASIQSHTVTRRLQFKGTSAS